MILIVNMIIKTKGWKRKNSTTWSNALKPVYLMYHTWKGDIIEGSKFCCQFDQYVNFFRNAHQTYFWIKYKKHILANHSGTERDDPLSSQASSNPNPSWWINLEAYWTGWFPQGWNQVLQWSTTFRKFSMFQLIESYPRIHHCILNHIKYKLLIPKVGITYVTDCRLKSNQGML